MKIFRFPLLECGIQRFADKSPMCHIIILWNTLHYFLQLCFPTRKSFRSICDVAAAFSFFIIFHLILHYPLTEHEISVLSTHLLVFIECAEWTLSFHIFRLNFILFIVVLVLVDIFSYSIQYSLSSAFFLLLSLCHCCFRFFIFFSLLFVFFSCL